MTQIDPHDLFFKDIWDSGTKWVRENRQIVSDISTVSGVIASIAWAASFTPLAPIATPVAAATSALSLVTGVATADTCYELWDTSSDMSSCQFGVASFAVSRALF